MTGTPTHGTELQGECAPAFAAVRDALAANFASRDEIGSAVSVHDVCNHRIFHVLRVIHMYPMPTKCLHNLSTVNRIVKNLSRFRMAGNFLNKSGVACRIPRRRFRTASSKSWKS